MRNSPPKYFRALLFCLLFSAVASGQLSKKHFIPPLTYAEFGNAVPQDQYIYISTPNNLEVAYTISLIGQPASSTITGTVTNNNPDVIFLGNGAGQLFQPSPETSTVVTDRGYIIDAEDVIYVSVRMRAGNSAQAGALVSKGVAALGTVFRSGSYTNENPQSNYLNFFSFMATEDNTTVTIDDLPTGIAIRNYTGSFPIVVNLNEGESYVVATNSNENAVNRDGLIGTLIESDKPIVMNSGSANGSFHNGNGRDYGIDQIVDFSNVGDEYIFVRGDGNNNLENILMVAHEDNTDVFINGGALTTTINAGEYYLIEGNEYNANGNMYVQTSKNVFAYQGVGGNGNQEPNQGMFFVPPLSCNNRGDLNSIADIQRVGSRLYVGGITIVTNKGSTVEINGLPIANFSPQGPFDVDGNPDYVTYKVLGLNDNVSVVSTGELYCAYFNFNGDATSGSFYSGFPSPPEIDFNLDVTAAGNCIPNITLEAFNIDVFDSVEWFYDNGNGFISTGETTITYKPLLPGGYKLVGTILCSGLTFDSPSVQVSICPGDFDGDLIIDNLDVDIDNDGVLNCDESRGDVRLDLSDPQFPELVFQDGTIDDGFADATTTANSSSGNLTDFSSDSDGNFTTTLGSALNASLEYRIDFQEDVNIEFRDQTGYSHTSVLGEVFSIIIGPSIQNITLLDPDNTILVDTDFDGIFEAGVDNFSTSEIRFRYNPTPNGTTPFRFVASNIDYVIFRHQLSNTTQQSSFQGFLGLTCFALDSDQDGNQDAYDLDNDNDGIPDLLEASGSIISLSNSDTDADGLDDIFNNVGVIPADTDFDGIPDYLDLDSDNDGIFDLFEAAHNLADTDLNGVIDNAQNTSGFNGLVDALETNPDSYILNYNVANTDNDIFINATESDSDDDRCPDVFEAGFSDGDDDEYLHFAPIQVDAKGLVLNAPDGYTIPNLNYIDFAPIVINSPFSDVEYCESETATIIIDATADDYQWQIRNSNGVWEDVVDDNSYSGATTNTLTISSLTNAFDGYRYRVFLERSGNTCGRISNAITLTVNPFPTLNNSVTLTQCDDNQDGLYTFDLLIALPLLSANHTSETFVFYPTQLDAENNTNAIANVSNYVNAIPTTETIWVEVTSNAGCVSITSFDLYVSTTQIPVGFLRTFNACDDYLDTNGNDTTNNDDRDGISSFDFSSVTSEILNLFPNDQQLSINYYETELDAQTQSDPITNLDSYRNIDFPNSQNIYVRIDDLINNSCTHIGSYIQLIVDPVPEINPTSNIELCDDDGDGIVSTFNLESRTSAILNGQNPSNFTVSYHTSEEDARNNTNPISNPSSFENTLAYQQTIYVRIQNNTTGCSTGGPVFDLIAVEPPTPNTPDNIIICDDDADGSALNGMVQNIDLDSRIPQILGILDPSTHQVSFHLSQSDAEAGSDVLTNPFANTVAFNQTIYIRLLDINTGCFDTDSFEVIVNPEPNIQSIGEQRFCDDDTDGILAGIDLDGFIPSILDGLNPNEHTVSFHESEQEVESGANPLASPYTNTTPYQQELYIRVIQLSTGCVNTSTSFTITIQPLPIVNPPADIEQCDDDTDGLASGFNLDAQTPIILGSLDPTSHPITFHENESDAQLGVNAISNSANYTNSIPYLQTIYVRVENTSSNCFTTSISFDLIVHPIPEVIAPNDLIVCDDGLIDGSTTNEIVHDIDLDALATEILGNQNLNDFAVTFHLSSEDALNGLNSITSPFSNTSPFSQTLFIRVYNLLTGCFNASATLQIIINPSPNIQNLGDIFYCDDDLDGDDANGFVQNIDLSSTITDLLGNMQDPDDFTVSFHESIDEASTGENPISFPYSNTEAFEQFIFVRVVNTNSQCFSFARSIRIVVSPLPQFDVITPQFICMGEDILELGVENPEDSYDYFWLDAEGNTLLGENITVTVGGTYSVTATNTDGSGCSKTFDIEVGQSSIPVLTEEHVLIDDGDDNNSITINNNIGVLGIGDYEFALLDVEGDFVYDYQDDTFFGNLRGGIYTILARDKNGCGEAQLEVALLEIPQFFTPNNDGINDFWNLQGITQEFIDYFPTTNISVFNRFGKFIANFTIQQQGWNGTYNGQVVISNDYWVKIELIDRRGKMRVETRNFALLRR